MHDARHRPSTSDSISAAALRGATAGTIVAVADWLVASLLASSVTPPDTLTRIAAVAVLPALGALLGVIVGRLPSVVIVLLWGVIGYRFGEVLVRGTYAQTLPLANYWNVIAGIGALGTAAIVSRMGSRRRCLLLAGCALVGFMGTTIVQRGRYLEVREIALIAVALMLYHALPALRSNTNVADRRHRLMRRLRNGALALVVLGGLGLGHATMAGDGPIARWVVERPVATAALAARYRRLVVRSFDNDDQASDVDDAVASFFGTRIAETSRRRLHDAANGNIDGMLFIVVDGWRHDMLGRDVGARPVTPFIDELARTGLVFERAYPPSAASHMSIFGMLSGLYPSQILARHDLDEVPLVTERLERFGIDTATCFSTKIHTASPKQHKFSKWNFGFRRANTYPTYVDPSVDELFATLHPDSSMTRFFASMHFMLPHAPFNDAPAELRTGTDDFAKYAAELRLTDRHVGELVRAFRDAGRLDRTWIVITSDHGEAFGEHGTKFHGNEVYEESIHVPLVIIGPGVPAGSRDDVVSLIDLAPTLEHLFALPDEGRPHYRGRSLVPLVVGARDPDRETTILCEIPPLRFGTPGSITAVIDQRWKLIVDDVRRLRTLHDLDTDPAEKHDVAARHPDRVADMTRRFRRLRRHPVAVEEAPPLEYIMNARLELLARAENGLRSAVFRMLLDDEAVPDGTDDADRATILAWYAGLEQPQEIATLAARGKAEESDAVQLARRLLRARVEGYDNRTRRDFVAAYSKSDDVVVIVALLDLFGDHGDDSLLSAPHPDVGLRRHIVDVARSTYRARLGQREWNRSLFQWAVASGHPWIERLAYRYVAAVRPTDKDVAYDLTRLYPIARGFRSRGALLDTLGELDAGGASSFILDATTDGDAFERRRAFRALRRFSRLPKWLRRHAAKDVMETSPTTTSDADNSVALTPGRTALRLRLPPGPVTVAVFLHRDEDKRRDATSDNRNSTPATSMATTPSNDVSIRLILDDDTSPPWTEASALPSVDTLPLIFDIPATASRTGLVLDATMSPSTRLRLEDIVVAPPPPK